MAHQLAFAVGPILASHNSPMDVGNILFKFRDDRMSVCDTLMNIGNDGLSCHNTEVNVRNDGLGVRDVMMNVGNDHVRSDCKFSLEGGS